MFLPERHDANFCENRFAKYVIEIFNDTFAVVSTSWNERKSIICHSMICNLKMTLNNRILLKYITTDLNDANLCSQ
jgi:hypothetical protein